MVQLFVWLYLHLLLFMIASPISAFLHDGSLPDPHQVVPMRSKNMSEKKIHTVFLQLQAASNGDDQEEVDNDEIAIPITANESLEASDLSSLKNNGATEKEDDLIKLIRGPLGAELPRKYPKTVFVISDTTGSTAKAAVQRSLAQFNGCDHRYSFIKSVSHDEDDDEECDNVVTRVFPYIQTEDQLARILRQAQDAKGLVVYTLADPSLRERASRMCELSRLLCVDLLGPMFDSMSIFFNRSPLGTPYPTQSSSSRPRKLSDNYYRRIEAVEYTLACDDGMAPHKLKDADVVLLGVSRTGKTPLSVYLSQTYSLKVANIPLVVDLPPPKQLFERGTIDRRRIFCLTLDARELQHIRQTRLQRELRQSQRHKNSNNKYADRTYLQKDLVHAQNIALEHNFLEIDVTGKAVEETASFIVSTLNERFPNLRIGE